MLVSESGRGVAITTVAVVVALGRPSIILLALLAVIEESLEVFSMLAERRYVRSLVDPGQVPSALVRSEARTHLVVLIGRPLGGLLFGLSRILPFALDVFSFVYIAGVLLRNKEKRSGFLKCQYSLVLASGRDRSIAGTAIPPVFPVRSCSP